MLYFIKFYKKKRIEYLCGSLIFLLHIYLKTQGDSPRADATPANKSSNWSIGPSDKKQYDGIFDVSVFLFFYLINQNTCSELV